MLGTVILLFLGYLGLLFHVKRHIVMFFLHSLCEGIPRWHDIAIPTMKGDLMGASLILSGCRCPPKCDAHAQTSFGCLAVQQDSKMYVYVICLRRFRRVYTTTYPSKSRTVRRTSTSHRVEVRFFSASSSRCTQHHPWAALRSRTLSWQARLHTEYGQRKSCSIGSRLTLFSL